MMPDERLNPDDLLASIKREEEKEKRGKLKIFLGMCPGVGKTYAMLQEARKRSSEGIDVLIGVVETHGRKETESLLEGLTVASKIKRPYRDAILEEMDIDTILMIRPQLAIVDELAHTNAPGSRHPKRYQDVEELLAAGINVYTTLNVQHVESRAETVRQITNVRVQETVPDSLLDEADEVALIDLSPEQLRQRLKEGKVYLGERAVIAADNFFKEENLTALREMALRVTAERVSQDLRDIMNEQKISGPWKSGECLLVAIGPTPFSESLIRWTRRSAAALNASWIAVYIETAQTLTDEEKKRLEKNLTLARQLGAEVIVRSGTDIAETLLQVARQNNVSQICVGKPLGSGFWFWEWLQSGSLIRKLIRQSGDIDIHMVRVKGLGPDKAYKRQPIISPGSRSEYGVAVGIIAFTTLICWPLEKIIGYSSISMIYLLSVMLAGVFISRWPVLLLGALSAFLWNFLFIPPRFTFYIYKTYDVIVFVMYFVTAVIMGQITTRLREREKAERKQEERVHLLYQLTRTMAITHDSDLAIKGALSKLGEILGCRGSVFLIDDKGRPDFENQHGGDITLTGKERSVANYAFQKQQSAGRFTDTLPESECFYLPLISTGKTMGILAIIPQSNQSWSLDQRNLIESFASLMTVTLEKNALLHVAEEAKIKIESEKLQAALLDSVSHELKTPLTIIAGTAEHLDEKNLAPETFRKLVSEIRSASHRLLKTVNSLLDMTRLDSGQAQPNLEWHDLHDVMQAALSGLENSEQQVKINYPGNLPLVKIDGGMIEQALLNLLSNALQHSPPHSDVSVDIQIDQSMLVINVSDQGPGIDENDLDKIFEKFYRGRNSRTGGLGLGLSITKRFIEAHGGEIEVRNREKGGAQFTFRVPVQLFDTRKKDMPS